MLLKRYIKVKLRLPYLITTLCFVISLCFRLKYKVHLNEVMCLMLVILQSYGTYSKVPLCLDVYITFAHFGSRCFVYTLHSGIQRFSLPTVSLYCYSLCSRSYLHSFLSVLVCSYADIHIKRIYNLRAFNLLVACAIITLLFQPNTSNYIPVIICILLVIYLLL